MKHCPDPETLAAWVDEGLHGDERSRVEHHAAGCARCQAHLAAMARMASADQPVVEPQSTHHLWRWLVPAAAAVTAVALWILVLPPPQPATSIAPTQPARPVEQPMASAPPEPKAPPPVASLENRARAADAVAAPEADTRILDRQNNRAFLRQRAEIEEKKIAGAQQSTSPSPAAPAPAPAPTAKEPAAMVLLGALPIEVVSPDPSKRWRASRSVIERSIDGGASWEAQRMDIAEHLTAGVAPSTTVAWIVGQRGVVLLTTDGVTWRRVPFPESIDLVSVQATDATHATVTTFDGRAFSTANATTWSPK